MKNVVWSNEASESLELIYNYIFQFSPQNAIMVIETILELGENLSVFPEKKSN